jgi:hypothetical protein
MVQRKVHSNSPASRTSSCYSIFRYEKDEKGMKKTSIGRTGTYNRSIIGHTGTFYRSDTADKRVVARTAPRAYPGFHALIVNQYTPEHTRMY